MGWKAIVAAPGSGTEVRTSAPNGDPTNGLRRYPEDLLNSPLDRREASFSVAPGEGTLIAPRSEGGGQVSTTRTGGDGFAGIFEQAASGEGVLFSCCSRRSAGALCTRSHRATARRWSRRIS